MDLWPFDPAHALGAIVRHPDEDLTSALRARLEHWLASLDPIHGDEEVRKALKRPRGMPLMPWRLDERELEAAVFAVRAAFSKAIGARVMRIVPGTSIGVEGGLRLTRSLRASYSDTEGEPWNPMDNHTGAFALGRIPNNQSSRVRDRLLRFQAELQMEDDGLSLEIPAWAVSSKSVMPDAPDLPEAYIDGLDVGRPIRVYEDRASRRYSITTKDPTTLVKLYAVAAEGTWLVWRVRGRRGGSWTVRVWLELPRSEGTNLVHAMSSFEWQGLLCPWMDLDLPKIEVPSDEGRALRAWFPWSGRTAGAVFWSIPTTGSSEKIRQEKEV